MYVRVVSFGTNWWAMNSRDTSDPFCFRRRAAWFNAAALMSGRRLRHCAIFPGQVRFNSKSGFDPEFPLRADWQDVSVLGAPPIRRKDALVIRAPRYRDGARRLSRHAQILGAWRNPVRQTGLEVCRRPANLDQLARRKVRSNAAVRKRGLGRERPRTMAGRSVRMPNPA